MCVGWVFAGNKSSHKVTSAPLWENEDSETVVDRLLDRLEVHENEGLWAIYSANTPVMRANDDFYRYMNS